MYPKLLKLLGSSLLAAVLVLSSACSDSVGPIPKESNLEKGPASIELAQYVPQDAWMVSTIRLGQLMSKMDYESLVHMPGIAVLYSMRNRDFQIDPFDPSEREIASMVTKIIRDPEAGSGIDLDQDAYLFLGSAQEQEKSRSSYFRTPSLPCFGVVLPLSDRSRFENLFEVILEASRASDDVKRRSENNVRYYSHADDEDFWLLALHEEFAYFQMSFPGNQLKHDEVKQHIASPDGPPAFLKDMLKRPFDLAVHLDFEGMLKNISPAISEGTNGELDAFMDSSFMSWAKGSHTSIELTAENGRLVLTERSSSGKDMPYDLVGPTVRDSMLDLLPAKSMASASVSLNMEGVRRMLIDLQKALGPKMNDELDMPPLDAQIPGLGLSIDEALSAFSGEITAALVDLPDEDARGPRSDVPEFVLALSTVDPAGKVYQDILKKKLLALFDKNLREDMQERAGISLVAKDNRLIMGSHGQAAILKSGKAKKPVGGAERTLLASGYLNLHVDAEPIAKAMEKEFGRDRSGQDHGVREEIAWLEGQLERPNLPAADAQRFVEIIAVLREDLGSVSSGPRPLRDEEQLVVDAFKRMEGLTLQATKQGETYLAEVALSLDDKKSNVLKQTGSFIGNFLDPAWRAPEMRPRIEAARKLAAKNPKYFHNYQIGTWKDEWEFIREVNEWEGEEAASDSSSPEPEVREPEPEPEPVKIHGVTRFKLYADGKMIGKSMAIEPDGYYIDDFEGTWSVNGNNSIAMDKHGLVVWVGGFLEHDGPKGNNYSITRPFEEFEENESEKVADDWQLPPPPKGLPKLERPVHEERGDEDWGDESGEEAWPEDTEVELPRQIHDHDHEGHRHHGGDESQPAEPDAITIEDLLELEGEEGNREPRRE